MRDQGEIRERRLRREIWRGEEGRGERFAMECRIERFGAERFAERSRKFYRELWRVGERERAEGRDLERRAERFAEGCRVERFAEESRVERFAEEYRRIYLKKGEICRGLRRKFCSRGDPKEEFWERKIWWGELRGEICSRELRKRDLEKRAEGEKVGEENREKFAVEEIWGK